MKRIFILCVITLTTLLPLMAQEIHQHGVAHCDIAVQGDIMEIVLTIPAISVVGFEHAPSTDEEHAIFDEAAHELEGIMGTELVKVKRASFTSMTLQHAEEAHADEHTEELHTDFVLTFQYERSSSRMPRLDLSRIFSVWPDIEEVVWVALLPGEQKAGEATPSDSRLNL